MSATTVAQIKLEDKAITPETPPVPKAPLKLAGVLNQYKSFEVTPVVGREYPEASLKEWLDAPNADALLRDLAITSTHALTTCDKIC